MNVYIVKFDGGTEGDSCGGGMALVAANDKHEAYKTIKDQGTCGDDDFDEFGLYYASENAVEEVPDVVCNLTEPKVIASNFYRE